MTLEAFSIMVRNHDLTYIYSDDHNYWARGERTLADIMRAAKEIPREDVVRIWNENVDLKIVDHARSTFYWR